MKKRSRRKVALLLTGLILAAVPVRADPITLGPASQLLDLQLQSDVRIGSIAREGTREDKSSPSNPFRILPETTMNGREFSSRLSGLTIGSYMQQQGQGNVQGDVQGRVCDCGEILIAGGAGGFPKWPLFFLGAIPLFLIHGSDQVVPIAVTPVGVGVTPFGVPPPPAPSPPSVIPEVPEYASLLLFGTGLIVIGAFGRQTFRRKRVQ